MVVPYIGTWIETDRKAAIGTDLQVVPYIGTWIETAYALYMPFTESSRTLYRYVD